MKITEGLEMLQIPAVLANGPGMIYPVIIHDENTVILVDTGFPGQVQLFRDEAEKAGIPFERLDKVIITHSDMDHIGGLSAILKESSGNVEVLAHGLEKPYIECEKPPIRMSQLEAQLAFLSGEKLQQMKALHDSLKANYRNFRADVSNTLSDNQNLPYCGGITVIHTPGHTPGHICLYIEESKVLIAGDVLNVENDVLVPCPKFTVLDADAAARSLRKLVELDIDWVICYHGGLYSRDAGKRIAEIAAALD